MKKYNSSIFFILSLISVSIFQDCSDNPSSPNSNNLPGNIYKILFYHNDLLESINSDGSGLKNLSGNLTMNGAVWSPDGSSISVVVDGNICIMDSGRTHLYTIANDDNSNSVSWSPDGNKLVYIALFINKYNVYVVNKDGTEKTMLTHNDPELISDNSQNPVWSPDGNRIAYTQFTENKCELNIINQDGTNDHPVTSDSAYKYIVKWFPGGDRLLVNYNYNEDDAREIYIVNADGSDPLRLTNNNFEDFATDLSADGSRILFYSKMNGNQDIYIMNSDGSNLINLTNTPYAEQSAVFSPDGKKIAFWTNRDQDGEIYLVDADGKNQINLTNTIGTDQWPQWCPVPLNKK